MGDQRSRPPGKEKQLLNIKYIHSTSTAHAICTYLYFTDLLSNNIKTYTNIMQVMCFH